MRSGQRVKTNAISVVLPRNVAIQFARRDRPDRSASPAARRFPARPESRGRVRADPGVKRPDDGFSRSVHGRVERSSKASIWVPAGAAARRVEAIAPNAGRLASAALHRCARWRFRPPVGPASRRAPARPSAARRQEEVRAHWSSRMRRVHRSVGFVVVMDAAHGAACVDEVDDGGWTTS